MIRACGVARARVAAVSLVAVPRGAALASTLLSDLYRQRVAEGALSFDSEQWAAVAQTDALARRFRKYASARVAAAAVDGAKDARPRPEVPAAAEAPPSSTQQLLPPPPDVLTVGYVPKGLYLHGRVGVGKTMLMDDLFRALQSQPLLEGGQQPPAPVPMRRVHFHAWMLEVHARIHAWKAAALAREGRSKHVDLRPERDAVVQVAKALAAESWLLCFDEFQITDVADALILRRLFTTLWRDGCVVAATSNRPPRDLYADGVNREYVEPFLHDLDGTFCRVHALDAGTDYRTAGAVPDRARFVLEP